MNVITNQYFPDFFHSFITIRITILKSERTEGGIAKESIACIMSVINSSATLIPFSKIEVYDERRKELKRKKVKKVKVL